MREIAQKLSRCSSFGALMDDAFARCPEREAIVYEDWRLTYGDLERYIHQTAHYLRHLGVRKGSRVAILSRNCPEWIIAEFALYQLGAIVVKINWRLTPPESRRACSRAIRCRSPFSRRRSRSGARSSSGCARTAYA